jgi:hypothetical protein
MGCVIQLNRVRAVTNAPIVDHVHRGLCARSLLAAPSQRQKRTLHIKINIVVLIDEDRTDGMSEAD